MPDRATARELRNAIGRADRGLSPADLMRVPEIDALYEHEGVLQAHLEALVRAGVLTCHERPGTHRYRLARTNGPRRSGEARSLAERTPESVD